MKRRRTRPEGSLDLLLDTICNLFGGIVFIAILVMLMLRSDAAQNPQSSITAQEYEQLKLKEQLAQSELDRQQSLMADQQQVVTQLAPPQFRQQLDHLRQTQEELDDLQNDYRTLRSSNVEIVDQMRQSVEDFRKLPEQIESLEQLSVDLNAEIEQERKNQTVRLPKVRGVREREYGLIVRYGRLYVWHRYDAQGNRLGLNTEDFIVVGEEGGATRTQPRPNAGVPLVPGSATDAAISSKIRSISPSVRLVAIGLHVDSFDDFAPLRDSLIALKIRYRLILLGEGEGLFDRGGVGGRAQ